MHEWFPSNMKHHVMMAAPFIDGDENKLSVADLDLALIKQAKEALKLLIRDKEVEQKGGRVGALLSF